MDNTGMNPNTQSLVVQRQADDEVEIDLLELAAVLLSRWKLLLLCAVICAGAAFAYCKFMVTPQYSSTAGLYVFSKSTSVTSLADLQIGSNLTTDYEAVITGRPILDRVITRLELDETYNTLKSKITVSNPADSRILYITVTDPSAERAKEIADRTASIAATFISQKMDQDPPSIIQTGYTDGAPVSPRTMRTTAMGGMIGLLLAAAWVVVTYLLNDTIVTPEDVQTRLGMEVLASLPLEEGMTGRSGKSKKRRTGGLLSRRKR